MLGPLFSVAVGGALGASLRYLTGVAIARVMGQTAFPLGILTVNVAGSFLMGVFIAVAAQRGLSHLSPLLATGFLGGFTTFSAFSLEAVTLYERGAVGLAALYVTLSVCLSIAGLVAGLWVARGMLA
ncbi:MAG: fluoride efflux transporter CrcB [Paracoccaceae bacterium]|nr:fluoride efflux transporter CrcB [Paracoccaceae bacterium]